MGGFLNKVLLVDLFRGLWVTFQNQSPKYIYIEQYPTERPRIAERYRGAPRLNVNPDTNETLCISCNLCALACPENLIVVTSVRNEQTRRKDLTTFTYDLSRCMFLWAVRGRLSTAEVPPQAFADPRFCLPVYSLPARNPASILGRPPDTVRVRVREFNAVLWKGAFTQWHS